jgi:hypothetical protein
MFSFVPSLKDKLERKDLLRVLEGSVSLIGSHKNLSYLGKIVKIVV